MLSAKFVMLVIVSAVLFPAVSVYGHGSGLDTIRSVDLQEKEITIAVELPTYFEQAADKRITITATDDDTGDAVRNITYMIGMSHEGREVFRDHFFTMDGVLAIDARAGTEGNVEIHGQRGGPFDAWHGDASDQLEITGPAFDSGGLYTFEIRIRTIDEPTNTIDDSGTYYADVTLVDTTEFLQADSGGENVKFWLKSYFDEISNFEYDPVKRQITFEMPFDWSEKRMSHIPVIHKEVHFPKDFAELLYPGYTGQVNGIDLFKSSVTVDDYTDDHERIVHFVLLQEHISFLKNQQKITGEPLPDSMVFALSPSEDLAFPLTAFTRSEDFWVDLSWDPVELEPGQKTNFIFTIRDGSTGEPMRNSAYTFAILQNGNEIHRVSGQAQVGGGFESYTFAEDQTGPTIIRFEDIRNSGQETEFGIMVAPEFGGILLAVLGAGMAGTIILGARSGLFRHGRLF